MSEKKDREGNAKLRGANFSDARPDNSKTGGFLVQLSPRSLFVIKDKSFNQIDIQIFGFITIMFDPKKVTRLCGQPRFQKF